MFAKGDLVFYGSTGVCQVQEVDVLPFASGQQEGTLYYWLKPVYEGGLIYAPVDGPAFIRPVLTPREVDELIQKMPTLDSSEYTSHNLKLMADRYRSAMKEHRCESLLRMMKGAYRRSQQSIQNGRKPGQMDTDYRKKAEKLIYGEFAVVLGIPYQEVPQYIEEHLPPSPTPLP